MTRDTGGESERSGFLEWAGAIVLTEFATTLVFVLYLRFGNSIVPPEKDGGMSYMIWVLVSLLAGIPWFRKIEGPKTTRFLLIILYVPVSLLVLGVAFGILGKVFGVYEGI